VQVQKTTIEQLQRGMAHQETEIATLKETLKAQAVLMQKVSDSLALNGTALPVALNSKLSSERCHNRKRKYEANNPN
jgi:uncharacterized coiled-coil protein SlyX